MFSVSTIVNNIKQLTCKNNIRSVDYTTDFFNGEVEILNKEDVIKNPYCSEAFFQLYFYIIKNELCGEKDIVDVECVEVN